MQPPGLPPHLYDVPLNAGARFADPYVVPTPQSVTLHHLFNASPMARTDEVLVVGMTQRWRDKYVTMLMYQPNPKMAAKKLKAQQLQNEQSVKQ